MFKYVLWIAILCGLSSQQEFEVPPATVEILHPKGFRVSIPDQQGIKLLAFHGKINEDFDGLEAGTFARDITRPDNGRWTFKDSSQKFKPGDVLYYWLYVDYNNGKHTLGYRRENQKFIINDIPKNNANKNKGPNYVSTPSSVPIVIPDSSCDASPTKVNGQNVCSGALIFEENFDNINVNRWQTEIKFANDPDYEFVIYINDPNNIYHKNGQLHIKPTFAEDKYGSGFVTIPGGLDLGVNCTGSDQYECKQEPVAYLILPPVLSGRINTKPSFSFVYGRVDIRAKLPKGDWIYPELFLTPKKFEYGTQEFSSGEIRVAFLAGNSQLDKELHGGIMLGVSDEARQFGLRQLKRDNSWNDDFHVFSTIWKTDSLQFSVDGEVYGNIYPPPGGFANVGTRYNPSAAEKWKNSDIIAPFNKEMILTIGVGVGGHSFSDSIPGKLYTNVDGKAQYKFYRDRNTWLSTWTYQNELIVDYIKVFAI
ncbi:GNBP3 [Trypoxylus dichotomus]